MTTTTFHTQLVLVPALLVVALATPASAQIPTGTVMVGTGSGLYSEFTQTGTLLAQLDTTTGATFEAGCGFDSSGDLITTNFLANSASEFGPTGTLIGSFGSGYNADPESVVFDAAGNVYIGQADGSHQILEFTSTGTRVTSFSPATESKGTDWIDLAPDQCTIFYTSEGVNILRFNICTLTQGANFNVAPLPGSARAHRIRPNGEVLVADTTDIVRLDAAGNHIQTYTFPGTHALFALNLDPDGTSFWTADLPSGMVFKTDIASGTILQSWSAAGVPGFVDVAGLCVKGEIIVSQPTTTTITTTNTTTTIPTLQACQQLVCDASGCRSAPAADGTACDNGDACGPDSCKAGACVDDALCDQTLADQQQPPGGRKPVTAIAARCSVEGAIGFCSGQGFVTQALVNEILHAGKSARVAVVVLHPLEIGADADVPVTKKARARFDRFGVARFSLKLNPLGRRLLKKATKLGVPLPVVIRFTLMNGGTTAELRRLVQLVQRRS